MDPALQEQLEGNPDDSVEVVIRLKTGEGIPEGFRVIARFGNILTGRVHRKNINELWSNPEVASVKASRQFFHDAIDDDDQEVSVDPEEIESTISKEQPLPFTGKGIFLGAADWGIDFTHPNFLNDDGSTRIHFLWDQTGDFNPDNNPYGYGRIFSKEQIDAALKTENPFETLGYHPGKADLFGVGSHGTHVMDIATGNGRVGYRGMAPDAMLLAVHLGSDQGNIQHTIGNSVRLLEGIHFLDRMAGSTPLIINLSLGKHGGAHTGKTLVEQALDELIEGKNLRVISQSAGNYFQSATHTSGRILPHELKFIRWEFPEKIIGHHEIEFWYSGNDSFGVSLVDALGNHSKNVFPGEKQDIRSTQDDQLTGRIYNRKLDPNSGFNHIHIYLYSPAPSTMIRILLEGNDITEGWYHGWIERVVACRKCQSVFGKESVDPRFTTGTICNGRNTISVGAYDDHDPALSLGFFSSAGPTVDLRTKPQCIAPGVKILAAKSSGADEQKSSGKLTYKSGTSMASPMVAGTCVLIAEALQQMATEKEIKHLLKKMLRDYSEHAYLRDRFRSGEGILTRESIWQTLSSFKNPIQMKEDKIQIPLQENAEQENNKSDTGESAPDENNADEVKEVENVLEKGEEEALDKTPYETEDESEEGVESEEDEEEETMEENDDEGDMEYINTEAETIYQETNFNQVNMEKNYSETEDSFGEKLVKKLENLEVAIEDKTDKFVDKVKEWLRSENLDGSLFKKLKQAVVPGEEEDIEIIGLPGQALNQPICEGDIILRHAPGEVLPLHTSIIADRNFIFPGRDAFDRYTMESRLPGLYVNVIEGAPFPATRSNGLARRLLDGEGLIPPHQLLVRSKRWMDDESESLLTSDPANTDFIKWVQDSLNQLQRAGLTVDGIAGPRTKASIRTFQLAHSLSPDGVAGPQTQAALEAAGAKPFNPSAPPISPSAIPANIKIILDQALIALNAALVNTGALQSSGSFDYTIMGAAFKVYFAKYDNAIIFYRTDSNQVLEVHGPLYQEYMKAGFETSGMPKSKLGIPFAPENSWTTSKFTNLGRSQLFDSGRLYWRRKDNRVIAQCMIPKDKLFWGVDATETYHRLVTAGRLIALTGYVPCFLGQYLPRSAKTGLTTFATNIHNAFQESFGLTRILIIDNRGTVDSGTRNGRANGKSDALDACTRADLCIGEYMQIAAVKSASPSVVLPESLVIYRDIEPEFHVDQDYIEGFIEGFGDFNAGSPIVKFNPGIYMSFHPTFRPFNAKNIDNLPDKNIRLWAQHPNLPSLTEANFIHHGYNPFSPSTVSCDVWQFNNGDPRFVVGKNFWIDHDMATAAGCEGFWQGDQELYMV